mmetsp:Transcript_60719/g.142030  ORF Transcript_60719/g.142030 Transcript_60719/m.142030 type:complete len:253 (-) Transcript_60719:333-1091(-)
MEQLLHGEAFHNPQVVTLVRDISLEHLHIDMLVSVEYQHIIPSIIPGLPLRWRLEGLCTHLEHDVTFRRSRTAKGPALVQASDIHHPQAHNELRLRELKRVEVQPHVLPLQPMDKNLVGHHKHVAQDVGQDLPERPCDNVHLQPEGQAPCEIPLRHRRREHRDLHPADDGQLLQERPQPEMNIAHQREIFNPNHDATQHQHNLSGTPPVNLCLNVQAVEAILPLEEGLHGPQDRSSIPKAYLLELDGVQRRR